MFKQSVGCVSHFWFQVQATLHEVEELLVALDVAQGQIVVEHFSIPELW